MKNPFAFTSDNKRYHTYNYYLRQKYGDKVFKVSLNGGFTCPNIDGTKGVGGCTYCSDSGSGDFGGDKEKSILEQFAQGKETLHKKWPKALYIPYFQAHTNTYAKVERLKELFEPVLQQPNVVGLNIATRPDCLPPDVLDYLAQLHERTDLMVELGLQSAFDETGQRINRCHNFAEFLEGYEQLRKRNIPVCVHIINGLPGETGEMMVQTVQILAKLGIQCIKIHLLHVIKGTKIAAEYENGKFPLLTLAEYVTIICDQLEQLSPQVVIQRVTGDPNQETLIGPQWSLKKFVVMNEIDKEFVRRNSWQGKKFEATW